MMRPMLALLLIVANSWAITAVLGSRRPALARAGWTLGIVALPGAGAAAWFLRGRRGQGRRA
jgi:hypothetical protein